MRSCPRSSLSMAAGRRFYVSFGSLQDLSDEYRVVFYDQRGTGLSPRENAEGHSIDLFLKELDGIVDAFRGNGQVRLIGHSWGGMLATAYIARHGEKVSQAVIMEPGILNATSARVFFRELKESQSIWTMVKASPYFVASLFVAREDGHEPKDYVMTKIMGLGKGKPYQCEGEGLPAGAFTRGGYASIDALMMPFLKHPEQFTYDLAAGVENYPGPVLLLRRTRCRIRRCGHRYAVASQGEQRKLPLERPRLQNIHKDEHRRREILFPDRGIGLFGKIICLWDTARQFGGSNDEDTRRHQAFALRMAGNHERSARAAAGAVTPCSS